MEVGDIKLSLMLSVEWNNFASEMVHVDHDGRDLKASFCIIMLVDVVY